MSRRNVKRALEKIKPIPERWDLTVGDMDTIRDMAHQKSGSMCEPELIYYGWLLGFADGSRYQKNKDKPVGYMIGIQKELKRLKPEYLSSVYHFVKRLNEGGKVDADNRE